MRQTGFKKPTVEQVRQKQESKRLKILSQTPKRTKPHEPIKKSTFGQNLPKKRHKKSELKKLKERLWQLCREITIKRDGSDCFTCNSKDLQGSNRQLGHFISSSICSTELRYDLKNLRIQCYACNINKSGNWLAYENRLIREYGEEYVKELKERNEKTKGRMYRQDWYEGKIKEYEGYCG